MTLRVGSKSIEVVEGDITEYDGEAIVNAANNHFWMGGGVAGAIKRKGGVVIEQEAMMNGARPIGEAVLTGAGALKVKYVIHAAVMGQDLQTDSNKILNATRSSLRLADSNKIESVAFPALGTGVGGFPLPEAAKIMIGEASAFLRHAEFPHRVTFILFDEDAYAAFADELRRMEE